MFTLDWVIVITVLVLVTAFAIYSKRYTQSVADFLAANRCAGRYLLSISDGIAASGAIALIAWFEMNYVAGFTPSWWIMVNVPLTFFLALSGWIVYRFRQTRALTMAQFFELRYSKNFRIFAGLIAFGSGILNFGIFPGVGARLFLYFCDLPVSFEILGITISTYAVVMFILLLVALFFTFVGGQIAVLLTDFLQGAFCNIMFMIILILLLNKIGFSRIIETLIQRPEGQSMLSPFQTGNVKSFNMSYYIIAAIGLFYNFMGWQGNQAYNASAKSAHEARMAKILGTLRIGIAQHIFVLMLPICAYVIMNHVDFSSMAKNVNSALSSINNPKVQFQMISPLAIKQVLPIGLVGGFCAVLMAAFISSVDTCLHSWGSILIQDIVLPFRVKPFTPKQHMFYLRLSVIGVAIFSFVFSLVFNLTQHLQMYFALTGAIFLGGSGSVIIGGLYWKKGTTAAAWSSMIVGSTLAVSGVVIQQYKMDFFINGQWMYLIAILSSCFTYIVVSWLTNKIDFDMSRMLHRDENDKSETRIVSKFQTRLGITKEFTKKDKIIYFSLLIWALGWLIIFAAGTIYNINYKVSELTWSKFWIFYIKLYFILGLCITVWFIIGGIKDLVQMFKSLKEIKRNVLDDGTVVNHHNLDE